ncbi:MAG TPA: dipeptidase [Ignavibacteria bacterium]|nr:dipeptidase [Ignavibacteria bacterium]
MKINSNIFLGVFIIIVLAILLTNKIFFNDGSKKETGSDSGIIAVKNFENEKTDLNVNQSENQSENQSVNQSVNELMKENKIQKDSSENSKGKNYLQIHYDAILIDTHNDFIWKVFDKGADLGVRNFNTQSDLPRFRAGGLDVQVFAVWIPMNQVKRSYSFTVSQIDKLKNFGTEYSSEFEFATNYDDIIKITNDKKICGLIGIEGGTAIEKNLDNINAFYEMGVRYIGLTWNNSNNISTSARDETERGKSGGLTEFGIQVIKRMNEVGMLVDVSHLSEQGFWDVIENSTSPVIASHSNCYAVNPHFRNLTDEQIKAIAENGGYIGINFYDKFLDKDADRNRTQNAYEKYSDELNALNEKYGDDLIKYNEERNKFLEEHNIAGGTSIEKVLDHIDHIKNLAGVDCIGIGSDFDGGITPPNELYDASCYPELTKRLVERGYTADEIKKILGGNFLRVFKQVCG